MPTAGLDGLPQRLTLQIPVPQRLSNENIRLTCDMVESRLRYLLGHEMRRRNAVRLQQRLDARAARKAARLDAVGSVRNWKRLPRWREPKRGCREMRCPGWLRQPFREGNLLPFGLGLAGCVRSGHCCCCPVADGWRRGLFEKGCVAHRGSAPAHRRRLTLKGVQHG